MKRLELGVIFDMDGVIIESNPYHKIAWTISSATNAGLRVIGVETSHQNHKQIKSGAIVSIKDFTKISMEKLIKILS